MILQRVNIFKSCCYQHWCQWETIVVKTLSEKTGWFISYYIILFIDNNIFRVWVRFVILVNWNQSDPSPFKFLPKEKAKVATVATLFGRGGLETIMINGNNYCQWGQAIVILKKSLRYFSNHFPADFSSIQLQYLVTETIWK